MLVRFLNETATIPQRNRVVALMGKMKRLSAIVKTRGGADSLLEEINRDLGRYSKLDAVHPAYSWPPGLFFHPPRQAITEKEAVVIIGALTRDGKIDRLRQCEWAECGVWFLGPTNRRFHLESCKRKHQSSSPAFKKKRAKYMKDRYDAAKARDERTADHA